MDFKAYKIGQFCLCLTFYTLHCSKSHFINARLFTALFDASFCSFPIHLSFYVHGDSFYDHGNFGKRSQEIVEAFLVGLSSFGKRVGKKGFTLSFGKINAQRFSFAKLIKFDLTFLFDCSFWANLRAGHKKN